VGLVAHAEKTISYRSPKPDAWHREQSFAIGRLVVTSTWETRFIPLAVVRKAEGVLPNGLMSKVTALQGSMPSSGALEQGSHFPALA